MKKRSISLPLIFIVALILLSGCIAKAPYQKDKPADSKPGIDSKPSITDNDDKDKADDDIKKSSKDGDFKFAIEYGVYGIADEYSKTGAHAVKLTPALAMWKSIQKTKDSQYDWTLLDKHVKEYQTAGFDYMQLLITAESSWASRDTASLFPKDTRPKQEYEDDYIRFVKAVVERYDKDGIDDMPGLIYPINDWGIEREFTGFFPGSGKDYVEVLKLAYPAIKESNENAKVMLVAILMWDIFQGNPDDATVEKRVLNPPNGKRKDITDIPILLDAYEYYDAIDFHFLVDYTEIPVTMKWINKEMAKRGISKEIYGGDVFPMSPLLAYGLETCSKGILGAKEIYPVTSETRCEASKLIEAIRKPANQDHDKAMEWIEKNIALNIPRKYVVASSEGLTGLNIGNLEDWPIPFGAGTASHMGMMDVGYESKGDQLNSVRKDGAKRPAFYALKMTVSYLDGFDAVKKLESDNNVYLYEFIVDGKKVVVGWYDDHKFYGLNSDTPEKEITLKWDKPNAKIVEVPTERNKQEGYTQLIDSDSGKIKLKLGYAPIFVS